MWTKYDYVCSDCDTLIEITTLDNISEWRGWCPCGSPNLTWISSNDATVSHVTDSHLDVVTPLSYN